MSARRTTRTARGHVPLGRFCRQSAVDGRRGVDRSGVDNVTRSKRPLQPLPLPRAAATLPAYSYATSVGGADKIFISMTCPAMGRARLLPDTAGWMRL